MQKTKYNIPVFENNDIADLKIYSEQMAEAIKTQVDKFGNPLIFKGTVSTLEELYDIENTVNGDIYAVEQKNKNYIWNGATWEIYSDNSININTTGGGTIVRNVGEDIATFGLTQNQTFEITTSWEAIKINFDTIDCKGDKLCLQDNKIIVGKGISRVLVSANISITEAMTGVVQLHIRKNGSIIGKRSLNYKNETYFNLIATSQLIDVEEGDEISLTIMPSSVQTEKTIRADATYMTIVAIQDGQNECVSDIVVSPTEPTADRRKVWFQKGKNFINPKLLKISTLSGATCELIDGKITINGTPTANNNFQIPIFLKKGRYVFSWHGKHLYPYFTFRRKNGDFISAFESSGENPDENKIITVTEDNDYLIGINIKQGKVYNTNNTSFNIQLEEGTEATEYKPYANPTIFVKNDNGIYEEFIKKEEKKGTILYENGQTTEDITLSDSIYNYDYIEIFYKDGSFISTGSKKFAVTSGIGTLELVLDGVNYINDFIQPFSSIITLDGKNLTRVRTGGVNIKTTTNAVSVWTGNIYITKVVGYKE